MGRLQPTASGTKMAGCSVISVAAGLLRRQPQEHWSFARRWILSRVAALQPSGSAPCGPAGTLAENLLALFVAGPGPTAHSLIGNRFTIYNAVQWNHVSFIPLIFPAQVWRSPCKTLPIRRISSISTSLLVSSAITHMLKL